MRRSLKKKVFITVILSLFTVMLVLTGCNADTEVNGNSSNNNSSNSSTGDNSSEDTASRYASAVIEIPHVSISQKDLSAQADADIAYLWYKAHEEKDESATGTETEWKEVKVTGTTVTIGPFAEGEWNFEIEFLNGNHNILYSGSTDKAQSLRAGSNNKVEMRASVPENEGQGELYFEIEADNITESNVSDVEIIYEKLGTTSSSSVTLKYPSAYESTEISTGGHKVYKAEVKGLDNGGYSISITMPNGVSYTNKVLVIPGETTSLKGELLSGEKSEEELNVRIHITVETTGDITGSIEKSEKEESTYYWKFNNESFNKEYKCEWSINGEVKGKDKTFTVPEDIALGNNELTCVVSSGYRKVSESIMLKK